MKTAALMLAAFVAGAGAAFALAAIAEKPAPEVIFLRGTIHD